MSFILFIALCLELNLASGRLVEKPNDMVVPLGTKVVLRCSTNLPFSVDWHRRSKDGSEIEIYSNGHISPSFRSEYAVDGNSEIGVYNLEIFSVAKIHEGNYTCIDNEGLGPDVASANLQILSTVTEDERIPVAEHQKNEQARTLENEIPTSLTTNSDSSTSPLSTFEFPQPTRSGSDFRLSIFGSIGHFFDRFGRSAEKPP